jgi:hypothetical protein
MYLEMVQNDLLVTLAHSYEENPEQFVHLPKLVVDSSETRMAMAELRNDGYLEEQMRGVVRLTPLGYEKFRGN